MNLPTSDINNMKKRLLTLFAAAVFTAVGAQTTSVFQVTPNPVDTVGDADDIGAHATIKNLTANTINLRWERQVISITPGCETAICDPVTCYSRTVNARNLNMDPNEEGELIVHFYTAGAFCEGIVHIKIKNLNNTADSTVAIYKLNQSSSSKELPAAQVKIFPNPFATYIALEQSAEVSAVRIFSLEGREVLRLEGNPNGVYSLDDLTAGVYVLALEDKNGKVFQASEITKR